jgi:hypothetical protein
MEELKPTSLHLHVIKLFNDFCSKRASFWLGNWDAFMKTQFSSTTRAELEEWFSKKPKLRDALTIIAELKDKHNLWFDFKEENVMERSNGEIVFTDPIV